MATLILVPTVLTPGHAQAVAAHGIGTHWDSSPPAFTATPADMVTLGPPSVHDDSTCSLVITPGAHTGTVLITEATSGATATIALRVRLLWTARHRR